MLYFRHMYGKIMIVVIVCRVIHFFSLFIYLYVAFNIRLFLYCTVCHGVYSNAVFQLITGMISSSLYFIRVYGIFLYLHMALRLL